LGAVAAEVPQDDRLEHIGAVSTSRDSKGQTLPRFTVGCYIQ
jgi:hypothetical protein